MFPELKFVAPDGTVFDVTVCETLSLLVQVTVLFTPMTTVKLSGAKPGAPEGSPAPAFIVTASPGAALAAVEVLEEVVVVVVAFGLKRSALLVARSWPVVPLPQYAHVWASKPPKA